MHLRISVKTRHVFLRAYERQFGPVWQGLLRIHRVTFPRNYLFDSHIEASAVSADDSGLAVYVVHIIIS